MEQEALDVIAENGGNVHYYFIADGLRISAHYAYVICKGLERGGYVNFDIVKDKGIWSLKEKGIDALEKSRFFKLKNKERMLKRRLKRIRKKF